MNRQSLPLFVGILLLLASSTISCQVESATDTPSDSRPNVVLIMVDDMGYSDIGCYGGEIPTPNIDALAAGGLRMSQFYNQARCCPTRATLMTGLYPHQTGIGHMTQAPYSLGRYDTWTENYQGYLNRNCVTMAEALGASGYQTFMSGKWHLGYVEEDRWPLQRGFERFYGILLGAASYLKPAGERGLTLDNTPLAPPDTAYYTTDAFTSYAVDFIDSRNANDPFFLYLAYNAPHWPLHAKEEDIELFKGKYLIGWDAVRTARFDRQQELGLLDSSWELSARDERVRAWDALSSLEKDSVAYRMAVYAAQVHSIDENVGRLVQSLKDQGEYENTIILFLSDNGASPEGYHELGSKPYARINDPDFSGSVSYGIGWANVSNTPFDEYKSYTFEGGISTPMIVHWPAGLKTEPGTITHQPAYLMDLMPTVLELTEVSYPDTFHGGQSILPLPGQSLMPILEGGAYSPPEYMAWEHQNNQAVRHGKWKLVKKRKQNVWHLFDLETDRTETNDLASAHPEIVQQLSTYWDSWAAEYGVLPKKKSE